MLAGVLLGLGALLAVIELVVIWLFGSTVGPVIGAIIATIILVKLFSAEMPLAGSIWAIIVLVAWLWALQAGFGINIIFPAWMGP